MISFIRKCFSYFFPSKKIKTEIEEEYDDLHLSIEEYALYSPSYTASFVPSYYT